MNLVARPAGPFASRFEVRDDSQGIVASFRHRPFRSGGSITVDARDFEIRRAGTGLVVEDGEDRPVAIDALGRGRFRVRWHDDDLELARVGVRFRLHLVDDGEVVGRLQLRGPIGRSLVLESQREVPPLVAAALFYLAVARRGQLLAIGR